MASRHGIDCWHGSPRHPLLGATRRAGGSSVDIDARVLRWHRKDFGSEEAAAAGM
jgi:hypothetical protein